MPDGSDFDTAPLIERGYERLRRRRDEGKTPTPHVEATPFVKGVTIRVRKGGIGAHDTERGPIHLMWEDHMKGKPMTEFAHEVEIVGPSRIVHLNPDPNLRVGSADCDVNAIAMGPMVVIEAVDVRIIR